jgi:hypothetical protein
LRRTPEYRRRDYAAAISFFPATSDFPSGTDTPRDLLERCLARFEEFEPAVGAFVCHDIGGARCHGPCHQAMAPEALKGEAGRGLDFEQFRMRIATYNVNGINGRLGNLLGWLNETAPDIVCLQELKNAR